MTTSKFAKDMSEPKSVQFSRPWLLLCEGESDKMFFHGLIKTYPDKLGNLFDVKYPGSGGRQNVGPWLSYCHKYNDSFKDNVKGVLIISDKDEDATASFREVCAGLHNAGELPVPDQDRKVAYVEGYPAITILMVPDEDTGNLETLCFQAALQRWPEMSEPVDRYYKTTPAKDWPKGKADKMKMQVLLSAICEKAPAAGLNAHWQHHPECNVPFDHQCFEDIREFLAGFNSLMQNNGVPV